MMVLAHTCFGFALYLTLEMVIHLEGRVLWEVELFLKSFIYLAVCQAYGADLILELEME